MAYRANPESLESRLTERIERQREIICELLSKNEKLRNRLSQIEHDTQSREAQQNVPEMIT